MTKEQWRKKHKRCKWCSHAQLCGPHFTIGRNGNVTYYECTAKDKVVNENKPRPFCRVFELGEPSIKKPFPIPPVRKLKEENR